MKSRKPVVTFSRELIGGHELLVIIPGLGTVADQDVTALWKQMAEKLEEIASSFKATAEAGAKRGAQA